MKRKVHKRTRGTGKYTPAAAARMSNAVLRFNSRDLHEAMAAAETIPHFDRAKYASYSDDYMTLHDERVKRIREGRYT